MLKVSLNCRTPEPVEQVIIYDDDVPVAAANQHGEVVYYCDAARDKSDLEELLARLGIKHKQLPTVGKPVN